jgi:hypothetical protein
MATAGEKPAIDNLDDRIEAIFLFEEVEEALQPDDSDAVTDAAAKNSEARSKLGEGRSACRDQGHNQGCE